MLVEYYSTIKIKFIIFIVIFRSIDGSCNCKKNSHMGRSNRAYSRFLYPDYEDGRVFSILTYGILTLSYTFEMARDHLI